MRHHHIADHLTFETLVYQASDEGYDDKFANHLAEQHGAGKPMSPRDHRIVLDMLRREVAMLRDKLVRKGVIVGGCPLPWEGKADKAA
jgi:hypothetical protein